MRLNALNSTLTAQLADLHRYDLIDQAAADRRARVSRHPGRPLRLRHRATRFARWAGLTVR